MRVDRKGSSQRERFIWLLFFLGVSSLLKLTLFLQHLVGVCYLGLVRQTHRPTEHHLQNLLLHWLWGPSTQVLHRRRDLGTSKQTEWNTVFCLFIKKGVELHKGLFHLISINSCPHPFRFDQTFPYIFARGRSGQKVTYWTKMSKHSSAQNGPILHFYHGKYVWNVSFRSKQAQSKSDFIQMEP